MFRPVFYYYQGFHMNGNIKITKNLYKSQYLMLVTIYTLVYLYIFVVLYNLILTCFIIDGKTTYSEMNRC